MLDGDLGWVRYQWGQNGGPGGWGQMAARLRWEAGARWGAWARWGWGKMEVGAQWDQGWDQTEAGADGSRGGA